MLLERDLIQSTGFRNVFADGQATGFQIRVRMPSYRGMAASLIDGISVHVPGHVETAPEIPTWTLQGGEYTLAQLWESKDLRWPAEEAAIVTVPYPGGLPDGVHEVSVELRLRMSYIPEEHQPSNFRETRKITLSPQGGGEPFRYGVSLYSFTGDYGTVMDLEAALDAIADLGATGVEILGEGHVPNYPNPSQEWIDQWFSLLEARGLEPTCYGSWLDTRLHTSGPDPREMTADEGVAVLQRDLRLARRLGFAFVRPKIGVISGDLIPHPIWEEVVERSLPLAEELNVIICPEIHSPTPIRHEVVDGYIELIRRTGTKHFGLLLDTGIFQDRPLPLSPGELPGERPAFLDGIKVDPADIHRIIDHVVFIQAKFHDIDESLNDQHIPWRPVLKELRAAGYAGYLSSEYEGERAPWRSIEQVRRQHSLLRSISDEL